MARSGTTRTFRQRRDDPAAFLRRDNMAWLILALAGLAEVGRSEEHTSELQSLMRISYAVFCLTKNTNLCYLILHTVLTLLLRIIHPLIPFPSAHAPSTIHMRWSY